MVFAGGKIGTKARNTYYYLNSSNGSATGAVGFWTMSPFNYTDLARVHHVDVTDYPGWISGDKVTNNIYTLRPVLSLKSCVQVVSGNGTSNSPYEVSISDTCASSDN